MLLTCFSNSINKKTCDYHILKGYMSFYMWVIRNLCPFVNSFVNSVKSLPTPKSLQFVFFFFFS